MGAKRSRTVTTSRTGGQTSTVAVVLLAAAGVGWFWWKKWKTDKEQQGHQQSQGDKPKSGVRSAFKFPGVKSSSANKGSSSSRQAGSAFTFPAGAGAAKAGGTRKGNPKKANKKQRREEKAAKKEAKGKGLELIHNAQLKEKEEEGPVTVKYVDMSKTADIYDKVREYQETGKKRYP